MMQDSSRFSPPELFALLVDDSAEEWHHKVGMDSPTRLLLSRGKVVKTYSDRVTKSFAEARASVGRSAKVTRSLGIWHPMKTWFILYEHGYYWPCNITPLLQTVACMLGIDERWEEAFTNIPFYVRLWSKPGSWSNWLVWHRVIGFCIRIALKHRLKLDSCPSNFGFERGRNRLFYLDDELYRFGPANGRNFGHSHAIS